VKKLVAFALLGLLVTGGTALAQEKAKADKPAAKPAAAKSAVGTVKSVAADSVVVTDKDGKDWTFVVDAKTSVRAKGAGTKAAAAKAAGKTGISITEAVKAGDRVTISFHDVEGKLHAESVRVM
jgi:hypothetical protein